MLPVPVENNRQSHPFFGFKQIDRKPLSIRQLYSTGFHTSAAATVSPGNVSMTWPANHMMSFRQIQVGVQHPHGMPMMPMPVAPGYEDPAGGFVPADGGYSMPPVAYGYPPAMGYMPGYAGGPTRVCAARLWGNCV